MKPFMFAENFLKVLEVCAIVSRPVKINNQLCCFGVNGVRRLTSLISMNKKRFPGFPIFNAAVFLFPFVSTSNFIV